MKYLLLTVLLMSLLVAQKLTVELNNVELKRGGVISIAVHSSEKTFPSCKDKSKYFKHKRYPVSVNNTVCFNLPVGEYSLTVFQDTNDNNKIDKNFIGLPTEPYGISNDSLDSLGRPIYQGSVINLDKNKSVTINLR